MNCKYPIRDEFPKILNDFTKSILYYKPKDILDFSFKYFYSLENNISLSSTLGAQLDTEISTKNEHKETIYSTIKQQQHEEILIKDNNNINNDNNEEIKDNDSKNVASNNNSEDENKSENNESEESEIDVYMSKDMAKIIKKQRKLKQLQEQLKQQEKEDPDKSISGVSGVSGTSSQKQGIKDFVDDLLF